MTIRSGYFIQLTLFSMSKLRKLAIPNKFYTIFTRKTSLQVSCFSYDWFPSEKGLLKDNICSQTGQLFPFGVESFSFYEEIQNYQESSVDTYLTSHVYGNWIHFPHRFFLLVCGIG